MRENGAVRATLTLALAILLACACAGRADAHGGEIIANAIEALRTDPVYVDPAAVPAIEPAAADRLRDRIRGAGGRIYVAVLPADAQHELPTADAVLEEIAAAIGGVSTFAVLVGGQFRAASVDRPEDARELEAELVADASADPGQRLERFVAGVEEARSGGSATSIAILVAVVGAAVLSVAALALLVLFRRRRSPPASPEGAI
jgi:hypothetical protein